MRIIKIILISVLVLIVVSLIAGVIFVKTFDINRYKPQIIAAAESALGRKFDFSTIDLKVSLTQGVRVTVRDIALGENPAFGTGDFLTIEEAYLGVDVLSFVLRKQVSISKALIKTPRVTIIRAQDGTLNAQSLGAAGQAASAEKDASAQSAPESQPFALPVILVSTMELTNGTVVFVDQSFEPALSAEIKQLGLGVNGFSLDSPFSFFLAGAVFGSDENVRIEGRAQIDPKTFEIKLSQVKSVTDFKKFFLDEIRQLPILPAGTPFPDVLEGSLSVVVKELTVGTEGLKSMLVDLQLEGCAIALKDIAPGISFSISQLNAGVKDFSLSAPFQWNVSGAYLSPASNLSLSGKASVDIKTQAVRVLDTQMTTELSSFSLEQLKTSVSLLKDVPFPDKIAGKLQVTIKEAGVSPQGLGVLRMDAALAGAQIVMKEVAPGVSFEAQKIDVSLQDFSLNQAFQFSLKAAYLSAEQNIFVEGRSSLDLDAQAVKISDTSIKTDLSMLALSQFKESVAALKGVPFPDELGGMLQVKIKEASAGPQGLTKLAVDVQLSDGKVVLNELAPGVGLMVSQADIAIQDFSLTDAFRIKGAVAYLSGEPNISFQGNGKFDMQTQQVDLSGFELTTDLSSFSMEQLRQSVAAVKEAPLPKSLKGKIIVALRVLTAGPAGLVKLDGTTDLSNGQIALQELAVPIDDLNAKIGLGESSITLPQSSLRIGTGNLTMQGKLDNYLTTQDYQLNGKVESISIIELIDQKDFPVKVHGLISGGLDLSGQGFDPAKMLEDLKGQGQFAVTEGKLTDINILKMVLDQLNFLPNIRQTLEDSLPPRFKEKLKQKDTIVTDVKLNIGIEQAAVVLNSLDMEADGFFFRGKGRVGFDQSFDFDGVFIIPQDMALSMAKTIAEFELLYDDQGQIQFPLKVSGKGAAVKFMPDMKYITTNVIKNKGRQEVQKVFDKVFEKKKPASGENQTPSDSGTEAPQEKPAEKVLIDGIFDSIFGQ